MYLGFYRKTKKHFHFIYVFNNSNNKNLPDVLPMRWGKFNVEKICCDSSKSKVNATKKCVIGRIYHGKIIIKSIASRKREVNIELNGRWCVLKRDRELEISVSDFGSFSTNAKENESNFFMHCIVEKSKYDYSSNWYYCHDKMDTKMWRFMRLKLLQK